jgi:hypothetical protein
MAERPPVPAAVMDHLRMIFEDLPAAVEADAWVGMCWRVGQATIAHVFGGEDQLIRITFRGEPDEVAAFEHLGDPYFRAGWGRNVIGLLLDDATDWEEVCELLTDSYCLQVPQHLAEKVDRPG